MRQHFTRVARQQAQQFILHGGKVHFLPVSRHKDCETLPVGL